MRSPCTEIKSSFHSLKLERKPVRSNEDPAQPNIHVQSVCVCICVHAKSIQSGPILCNAVDGSLPGSSVHVILWARVLEWVAMLSSRGCSRPRE